VQGLRLTSALPANSKNRQSGQQRDVTDSQPTGADIVQAKPTLVVRF
jgi:hypothetical protein